MVSFPKEHADFRFFSPLASIKGHMNAIGSNIDRGPENVLAADTLEQGAIDRIDFLSRRFLGLFLQEMPQSFHTVAQAMVTQLNPCGFLQKGAAMGEFYGDSQGTGQLLNLAKPTV